MIEITKKISSFTTQLRRKKNTIKSMLFTNKMFKHFFVLALLSMTALGLTSCQKKDEVKYNTKMTISVNEKGYVLDAVYVKVDNKSFTSSAQSFDNYEELDAILKLHSYVIPIQKDMKLELVKEDGYKYEYFSISSNENKIEEKTLNELTANTLSASKENIFMIRKSNKNEQFDFAFKIE